MHNELLPPIKIAVLIDGGFFIKRFNTLYNKNRKLSGAQVADLMYAMAHKHVGKRNILYRIFYYDCIWARRLTTRSARRLWISAKRPNISSVWN